MASSPLHRSLHLHRVSAHLHVHPFTPTPLTGLNSPGAGYDRWEVGTSSTDVDFVLK